jgi:hypothetical protein
MPPDAWTGTVEVDEVDPARSRLDEAARQGERVGGALDDVVVPALLQPDSLVAEDVDGGDHLQRQVEPHVLMLAC